DRWRWSRLQRPQHANANRDVYLSLSNSFLAGFTLSHPFLAGFTLSHPFLAGFALTHQNGLLHFA
ncbi:MAG: hypothetical protein WCO14_05150, partial [bacterium]